MLGHVAQVKGRQFRCPKCGLIYNRDLNACINIAHALKRGMGWGSREPPEPANEEIGAKPTLNAGSSRLSRGVAHNQNGDGISDKDGALPHR